MSMTPQTSKLFKAAARFTVTFVLVVLVQNSVSAQLADASHLQDITSSKPFGTSPVASSRQLFDLSRIHFQHSYSMSFLSGNAGSASLGMLQTTMFYEFAPNLSLAVGLAVAHDPLSLFNQDKQNIDARLLPSFRLDYQPSKNVFMSISFERRESLFGPYNSINQPYTRRGLFDY